MIFRCFIVAVCMCDGGGGGCSGELSICSPLSLPRSLAHLHSLRCGAFCRLHCAVFRSFCCCYFSTSSSSSLFVCRSLIRRYFIARFVFFIVIFFRSLRLLFRCVCVWVRARTLCASQFHFHSLCLSVCRFYCCCLHFFFFFFLFPRIICYFICCWLFFRQICRIENSNNSSSGDTQPNSLAWSCELYNTLKPRAMHFIRVHVEIFLISISYRAVCAAVAAEFGSFVRTFEIKQSKTKTNLYSAFWNVIFDDRHPNTFANNDDNASCEASESVIDILYTSIILFLLLAQFTLSICEPV